MKKLHCIYKDWLYLSIDYQKRFSTIKTVWQSGKILFTGKKVLEHKTTLFTD